MTYRVYEDDPVYKLSEQRFSTIEECKVAAQLTSQLTGNNTMVYDVDDKERIDLLQPLVIFFNGVEFVPKITS